MGGGANQRLLDTILLAHKYHKKIFLLPQSFGPFDFSTSNDKLIQILSLCDKIFCREEDGYNLLKSYHLQNIVLSNDLVLESSQPYEGIYKHLKSKTFNFAPHERRALIVPNKRVFERADNDMLSKIYQNSIQMLLEKSYKVYIASYDLGDVDLSKDIKNLFPNNQNVILIETFFNCIDFTRMLPHFDVLISSRFHSIVHAYKNFIPAMVIGWAVKYISLTKKMGQEKYMFDARQEIYCNEFNKKLEYMITHLEQEKDTINKHLLQIQQNSCFNILWKYLYE